MDNGLCGRNGIKNPLGNEWGYEEKILKKILQNKTNTQTHFDEYELKMKMNGDGVDIHYNPFIQSIHPKSKTSK